MEKMAHHEISKLEQEIVGHATRYAEYTSDFMRPEAVGTGMHQKATAEYRIFLEKLDRLAEQAKL